MSKTQHKYFVVLYLSCSPDPVRSLLTVSQFKPVLEAFKEALTIPDSAEDKGHKWIDIPIITDRSMSGTHKVFSSGAIAAMDYEKIAIDSTD